MTKDTETVKAGYYRATGLHWNVRVPILAAKRWISLSTTGDSNSSDSQAFMYLNHPMTVRSGVIMTRQN